MIFLVLGPARGQEFAHRRGTAHGLRSAAYDPIQKLRSRGRRAYRFPADAISHAQPSLRVCSPLKPDAPTGARVSQSSVPAIATAQVECCAPVSAGSSRLQSGSARPLLTVRRVLAAGTSLALVLHAVAWCACSRKTAIARSRRAKPDKRPRVAQRRRAAKSTRRGVRPGLRRDRTARCRRCGRRR